MAGFTVHRTVCRVVTKAQMKYRKGTNFRGVKFSRLAENGVNA